MPRDWAGQAFLGVERSLTGRRWVGPDAAQDRLAEAMHQTTGLPRPLCLCLVRRGVAAEAAEGWLSPALRDLLPDPLILRDMGPAADRLLAAVAGRERVAVFADYDVDGACSAALLLDWLAAQGIAATLYIPDRLEEGYGPNAPAMARLARGHDLILCVDCGTLAHDALAAAQGADVVVLDHHLGGAELPPARAVVNPCRQDEDGALAHLCAAGVVFLLLVEANRRLRAAGRAGPDLMAATDLVALATVADLVPLAGVNRALVRTGLKVMARRARPGLRALADVSGLDETPRAHHLGFLLGPRINAGGRVGQASLGARLLTAADAAAAEPLARELDALNRERQRIEAEVAAEALAQAERRGLDGPLAWAAGSGWHPGVVGIVAARLCAAAGRPAVVIALDEAEGKGSGRSVPGVDLGAAVQRLAGEGLLVKGGGHPMAAGLTVAPDRLEAAMDRLAALLGRQGAGTAGPRDLALDGLVMPGAATAGLIEGLERAGPFGSGAPAPRFALPEARILSVRRVGERHLKLALGDGLGARLDAIAFGACDGPLAPALESHGGARFHVAGRLELNSWNGRTAPQLRLEDAAPA